MTIIEKDDKQIETAAKSIKVILLKSTNSEKEKRDISDKIDEIERDLKILNRMTEGRLGQSVNGLWHIFSEMPNHRTSYL